MCPLGWGEPHVPKFPSSQVSCQSGRQKRPCGRFGGWRRSSSHAEAHTLPGLPAGAPQLHEATAGPAAAPPSSGPSSASLTPGPGVSVELPEEEPTPPRSKVMRTAMVFSLSSEAPVSAVVWLVLALPCATTVLSSSAPLGLGSNIRCKDRNPTEPA